MLKRIINRLNIQGDKHIWLIIFLFSLISLLAVYSATGSLAYKHNSMAEAYLFKHFVIFASGIFIIYASHSLNYKTYSRISQLLLYIAVPLLLYTMFFGSEINGARRWISLPAGLSFQASDLAKLAIFMYLARALALRQEVLHDFYQGFLPLLIPIAIICALILPENFSTSAVTFFTCFIILFLGRVPFKFLFSTVFTVAIIAIISAIIIMKVPELQKVKRVGTWKKRIESFMDKSDKQANFQVLQSKIAIARGGLFGVLPGNSVQRNNLPEAFSDYIFAIICEEYGFIGALVVIGLYLFLLYRVIKIVLRSPNTFGALLALGLGVSIVLQSFINMGVATNLLPSTGLTLPFISLGGSSIWFLSLAIGIILSVSRENFENNSVINYEENIDEGLDLIQENEIQANKKMRQSDPI